MSYNCLLASRTKPTFRLPRRFILSASIWLGISALFWWHVWLILTGQGTIDYLVGAPRVPAHRCL